MPTSEYVEFRKVRDFGDVINVTFTFLRQNLSVLGKSLLLLVGPVALLGGLSSLGFWGGLSMDPAADEQTMLEELNYGLFGLSYLSFLLLSMLSTVLAITVINGFMLLYEEQRAGALTLQDVIEVVKARFWDMLSTALFSFLLYMSSILLFVIPVALIAGLSSPASAIIGGLVLFVCVIVWFIGLFYFIVLAALLFPVRMHEGTGIFEAVGRCRYLIAGNYGNSVAVIVVSMLLMVVLNLVFSIPSYVLAFMGGLHAVGESESGWMQYTLTLASIVGTLGSSLLYAIPATAIGLQYFSLVEKKERTGLMQRIEELDEDTDDLF